MSPVTAGAYRRHRRFGPWGAGIRCGALTWPASGRGLAGPARRASSQGPGPVLPDQVLAEAPVRGLLRQLEAGPLVDPPGLGQHAVGPEHDLRISRAAREAKAFVDQPRPDPQPARRRSHVEQPELRD